MFQPRLGFVTYGTASTLLSPVLCKRFFNDFPSVSKEMREAKDDTSKLGIGGTGGGEAMSALEGLVAAIEVSLSIPLRSTFGNTSNPAIRHPTSMYSGRGGGAPPCVPYLSHHRRQSGHRRTPAME